MRILWLYRYTQHRHYNHYFHSDFARAISKQYKVNLKFYGYRMHEKEEFLDLMLKKYDEKILMSDLKKEFDYDVIVLDCWNRAYKTVRTKDMWIPEDFRKTNTLKICIEGDYHNIRDSKWYLDLGFDLILHRHLTNVKRAKKEFYRKNIWMPCSIDNMIFKPNPEIQRKKVICCVGEMNNKVYIHRISALKKLQENNLVIRKPLIMEEEYIKCLQSYTSHLNGSSIFDLNIAKMFEIMSSGSVLLTDKVDNIGMEELFPKDSYCTYKRDGSDIIKKAKQIINNKDYRDSIIKNALKVIDEKHTHKIRAKQFINIIKKEFGI